MNKAKNSVGRPPKLMNKLTHSINLKLSEVDYQSIKEKARKLNLTTTVYARNMVLDGYIKAPFTSEQMRLMRNIAGAINNLNQYVKHLNSGEMNYKLHTSRIVTDLKKLLDDSKKH